jgi:hypothetical protein
MPKDKNGRKEGRSGDGAPPDANGEQTEKRRLKRRDYENKLRELHVKLVELQEWVRREDKKVCIVFEGRDGARRRKGGLRREERLEILLLSRKDYRGASRSSSRDCKAYVPACP